MPDAMKSISGILNFANQAQQLRTAQQDYERGGVSLERERGLLKPAIRSGVAAADTAETGANAAKFKLQGDQQAAAMQIVGGLNGDQRIRSGNVDQALDAIYQARDQMIANGIPRAAAEWQTSQLISRAHQPGAIQQLIETAIRQNQGAQGQSGVVNAPLQALNTGAGVQFVQPQPNAPGGIQPGAKPIALELPLGEREQVTTSPVTNSPQVTQRNAQGQVTGVFAPPSGPAPAAPAAAPTLGPRVPQLAPGDTQELGPLTEHRVQARAALAQAPELRQNNRGILEEIDKVSTGAVGPVLQKVFGVLGAGGAGFDTPEKRASAYDLLGKYLERNALQTAQAMGPHTNSGLETVKAAQGSTAYNPTAIKKITKLIDANVTGAEAYQPGLEKAIENGGNQGVFAVRAYQQAWGQNYDPRITMMANAKRDGDKAEYDSIVKSLGGQNSVAFKELARKAQNLDRLNAQGRL